MSMSPRERADKVRDALVDASLVFDGEGFAVKASETHRVSLLLPPGSLLLTADEAETVRDAAHELVEVTEAFATDVEALILGKVDVSDEWEPNYGAALQSLWKCRAALALLSPEGPR